MKILFLSREGQSLSIAQRTQTENHSISFYTPPTLNPPTLNRIGIGIVPHPSFNEDIIRSNTYPISSNIDKLLNSTSPDLVVFDSVGYGRVSDYIRKKGFAILGGCRWADTIHLDTSYSTKMLKTVGIKSLPKSNLNESVNVSSSFWWDSISSSLHTYSFPSTRLMNDGLGPKIECAGTILHSISPNSRFVREGITLLERLLKKTNYKGLVTLNTTLTPSSLYAQSLVLSFNYDTIFPLLVLYRNSLVELLWNTARGALSTSSSISISNDYAISVRLTTPPSIENVDIYGINSENNKHIWLTNIFYDNNLETESESRWKSTGPNLLSVTAHGRDIAECRARVYRTLSNLDIKSKQYRTDIGIDVGERERILKSWGWI